MIGQHILFKWPKHSWCLGKISSWNSNPNRMVCKQIVNFTVFYPDDSISGPHCLSLDNHNIDADNDSPNHTWLLIELSNPYNSVQARDDSVQQDIIHRVPTSPFSNTRAGEHIAPPGESLELSESERDFDPIYYNILFTTHVVFLQRLAPSPLDLCCFSLHLCRLSPISISSLGRYISLDSLSRPYSRSCLF